MTRYELESMQNHVRELEKVFYGTQECAQSSCNACPYNDICEVTTLLFKLILYKIDRYNAKGELKDDNN